MTAANVNGITIEYESLGDGPPLLLIMGLGGQLINWPDEFVARIAARGFRVVRFDNRDIGLSTKMGHEPPTPRQVIGGTLSKRLAKSPPYTLSDMAADAAGLLDHLQIGRAHVVGASMGGMIAQTLAIEHPAKVASLTSIMSNTGDRKNGRIAFKLMRKMPKYLRPDPDKWLDNAVAVGRLISGPLFDEAYERDAIQRGHDRDPDAAGTSRQTMAINAGHDRTKGLSKLRVPALVVHGLADPLVQPSGGIATANAIPGSRLLMFPDMGHNLPKPRWDETIDAIATNAARAADMPQPEPAQSR